MTKRERFLVHIMGFVRIPYIWGGADPKIGLDCSGFAQHLLKWLDLDPPGDQSAQGLMRHFMLNGSPVDWKAADLGDLLFFGFYEDHVTHVAIALGEGLMVEAAGGGRATTSPEIAMKQRAWIRVSNVSRRNDLVRVIRPRGLEWGQS